MQNKESSTETFVSYTQNTQRSCILAGQTPFLALGERVGVPKKQALIPMIMEFWAFFMQKPHHRMVTESTFCILHKIPQDLDPFCIFL